jgi:hypothetical protein
MLHCYCLLLRTAFCYVETANLDGETNLKIKMCPEATKAISEERHLPFVQMRLKAELPNGKLDAFNGELIVGGAVTPLLLFLFCFDVQTKKKD